MIYTGHHYYGDNDPEHFWQNQNMASSTDGITFTKFEGNPIIATPPTDNTQHFRDPKVWERDGEYYLILGSPNKAEQGRVLLYKSSDLIDWHSLGSITNYLDNEGFMWEYPDLFRLNGKDILVFSPQGITASGKDYLNLYQTGYVVGELDYTTNQFERSHFVELDKGHDFYAAQTMLAPDGRRILIGWMAMWETDMPEQKDGWAGALTLPRELVLENDHLYMKPVQELTGLRKSKIIEKQVTLGTENLNTQNARQLENNLSTDMSDWTGKDFSLSLTDQDDTLLSLTIDQETKAVTLYRKGNDPYRYGSLMATQTVKLQAFIDTSSIEIFLNDGELVFSERLYSENPFSISINADQSLPCEISAYTLKNNTK